MLGVTRFEGDEDYMIVLQEGYCENCGKKCTNELNAIRCMQCSIDFFNKVYLTVGKTTDNMTYKGHLENNYYKRTGAPIFKGFDDNLNRIAEFYSAIGNCDQLECAKNKSKKAPHKHNLSNMKTSIINVEV